MAQESTRRPKFELTNLEGDSRETAANAPDPHAFNAVVGESIRRARQEHGWTQAALAERAGLSPNYIARLERGELGASLFVAAKICEALSITIDSLMGTSDIMRSGKRRVAGEPPPNGRAVGE